MEYISPQPKEKSRKLIERDRRLMFSAHTRSDELPLAVDYAKGVRIWDIDGDSYLDFTAGYAVCATGHCNEEIIRAVEEQTRRLVHIGGSDFYYEPQVTLAEKLIEITPGSYDKRIYFGNSGAESLEAALKIARYFTRRPQVISFFDGFHGRTYVGMSLSGSKKVQKAHFSPLIPEVTHTFYPYCYRCPLNLTYPGCIKGEFEGVPLISCVDFLLNTIFKQICDPEDVGAIFVEPIQGAGGYIVPPEEFLLLLSMIAKKWGIILVMDEIQSGLGRTGKWFASDHFGVEPDIVCIAKALGAGLPISATVGRADLMDAAVDKRAWVKGSHGSTFGGNPVACAAGIKTLELLEGGVMENAGSVGSFIMERLKEIKEKHRIIGDVRGKGLMIGIELVKDKKTKERFPENLTGDGKGIKEVVIGSCFKKGLFVLGCGRDTIRFSPPLVLREEEAEEALSIFESAIEEIEGLVG